MKRREFFKKWLKVRECEEKTFNMGIFKCSKCEGILANPGMRIKDVQRKDLCSCIEPAVYIYTKRVTREV